MAKKERLVLVDGSAVFHRGYHAIPHLSNAEGIPTNATYGFTMIMLKVLADLKPKYAIVTWDKSSDTFRKELYPEYKATRKKQPDDLYAQIPYTRQVTEALGIPWVELDNYEADDIIGTLGRQAKQQGLETIIVTGDLDELQLIDENTKIYTMRRGFTDTVIYDLEALHDRYGVNPQQFIDLKALKGDASDNIPGVAGVGEKTAKDLIATYGSLDEVYNNLDQLKGKLKERLETNKEMAYLSQKLSTIVCDAPVTLNLNTAEVGQYNKQQIHELFRRMEFKALLTKLPPEMTAAAPNLFDDPMEETHSKHRSHLDTAEYKVITTEDNLTTLIKRLNASPEFAFDTETTSVNEMEAELVGVSISLKEAEGFYIPVGHAKGTQLNKKVVLDAFRPVFENPKIGKIAHNAKYDYKVLVRHGITPSPIIFDTMIAAFLLNPLGRSQSLDDLAYKEFGIEMIPIAELIGSGRTQITFDNVPLEAATTYAAEDADITWRLYKVLAPELSKQGFDKLAHATEFPLIEVLAHMEIAGIELDGAFLNKFNEKLTKDLAKLEENIWEAAGQKFNIGSPAQLSDILFNQLKLSTHSVKKGKTGGYSTAAVELEKLKDAHPIIPMISDYRELSKLQSTYVETLPKLVDGKGRIHTRFNQTIAQTGRLNSTDPNLQNIPVRTEIGREIRKAFVAPRGKVFVSADYSQIELRIAAALSKDKGMIETFRKGIDLHQQTAAEMFGVSLNQVTPEQRYGAKTINFGVLYGMSPHGLSVATGVTRDEAVQFIDRYFQIRKTLKQYIEGIKEFAHKHEYTETLLGRRRPSPEINSNNFQIRNAAERIAVNVPLQGTAADIIKLAMIALVPKLPVGAQLLLQIHDELIVEANEKQAEAVAGIMKDTMENIYDLGVPIAVDTKIGHSWGDL
ncbi:MAG TPA: DNA polymerase I [Candidatus Saccharimonadia bacterium]